MKNLKIGVIGAGAIGISFAEQAAANGYDVMISNSRGPESLAPIVKSNPGLRAVTKAEAAQADVIMIAVQWKDLEAATSQLPSLVGKIVLDPMNPVLPGFILADLDGKTSSEVVKDHVSGAKLVKVFNTLQPQLIAANPQTAGGKRVIFFSGDHTDAKHTIKSFLEDMGFAAIDLGGLVEGGNMQRFPGGPLAAQHFVKY